jgi:hypothetical protein
MERSRESPPPPSTGGAGEFDFGSARRAQELAQLLAGERRGRGRIVGRSIEHPCVFIYISRYQRKKMIENKMVSVYYM